MTWEAQIEAIAADRESGASSVAVGAARIICEICKTAELASQDAFTKLIQKAAHRLVAGQPEMASLLGLLNQVFFAATGAPELETALTSVTRAATAFAEHMEDARREVVRRAKGLIPAEVRVLTHTSSSTVASALTGAAKAGRNVTVYCNESRPLYEGRTMAAQLADAGIEVILTVDAAAYANLKTCELVLLGADTLTGQGVVNKVGSAVIAVCAQSLGLPVYILTDTTKVWPADLGSPPLSQHPTGEVWPNAPDNVEVSNFYFDLTPWQAVSGVITERGLLTPGEIRAIGREQNTHRFLQTIVANVRGTL
jgi:translation initiation factor 2B subunit (eIF-2B alpha/beta/delta family)